MSEKAGVKVVIRFRPFNKREQALGESKCLFKISDGTNLDVVGTAMQNYQFAFDKIFGIATKQTDVYDVVGRSSIEDVMAGYNATIFAYGQTGAGKSFTMMGDLHDENIQGIIPRAAYHIFRHIEKDESSTEYSVKCSYLEIYNEQIQDLLDPTQTKRNLKVHESPAKGIYVADLTEEYVYSPDEIFTLLDIGGQNRAVAATNMNAESSRSHSVFIIEVMQKTAEGSTKSGRLNLVDLAGSEKVGKTGATGQTLEEAKGINKSLSALGLCINALVEGRKHIPYRDSKLTRILQESLGGNCKTTLVCACSPHDDNFEETVSTLKFGQRAKTIKNTVKANTQKSAAELQRIIDKLKEELVALKLYCAELEKRLSPDIVAQIREASAAQAQAMQQQKTNELTEDLADDDANSALSPDTNNNPTLPSSPSSSAGSASAAASMAFADSAESNAEMLVKYDRMKEEYQAKIANLETDLGEAKARDEEWQARWRAMEEKTASVDKVLGAKDAQMQKERDDWQDQKTKLEFERQQLEMDMEHVLTELDESKAAREKLQKEHSQLRREFNEFKMQNSEVEKLQAEQDVLFEELAAAEEKCLLAQEKTGHYKAKSDALEKKCEGLESKALDVAKERDELYEYVSQMEADIETANVARIEAEGKVKLLETQLQQQTQGQDAAASEVDDLRMAKIQLETSLEKSSAEIRAAEARADMETAKSSSIVEKNEALQAENAELKSQVNRLMNSLDTLAAAMGTSQGQGHHGSGGNGIALSAGDAQEMEKLRSSVRGLESEKMDLESSLVSATHEADENRKKVVQLQTKLGVTSQRCELLEAEISRLRQQLLESQRKSEEATTKTAELETKLNESEQAKNSLEALNANAARRPRIWKPIQKPGSSILEVKEEFGQHKLRSTNSPWLERARQEALASESPTSGRSHQQR